MSLRGEYKSEDDTRRTFVKSITLGITQESGLALPVIIIFLLLLQIITIIWNGTANAHDHKNVAKVVTFCYAVKSHFSN